VFMSRLKGLMILVVLCLSCATTKETTTLPPVSLPQPVSEYPLWQGSPQASLFSDHRAMQVGDVITIKVVESAVATKKAQTKTSRKSSIGGAINNFFSINLKDESSISADYENAFEGAGSTSRSDKLITTISAQVIKVFPNGNMMIEGKRDLIINNERRCVVLRGIVRPQDISPNNEVLSTYIANAQIFYKGKGVVSDKQRPGWFIRIFDNIWPF